MAKKNSVLTPKPDKKVVRRRNARNQLVKDLKKLVKLIERIDTPIKLLHATASTRLIKTEDEQ